MRWRRIAAARAGPARGDDARVAPSLARGLVWTRLLTGAHPPPGLRGGAAPALIVTGELDRSRAQQEALRAQIDGAEQVIVPAAGHLCNMERPDLYDAAVLEFLARRAVSRAS